jgi:hypothetical protein
MKRTIGAMALCGLVWVAAGCSNLDVLGMLALRGTPDGNERVVAGSLNAVAETTKASLARLSLKADVTTDGQKMYIDTATRTGARFRFVLTRETSPAGERTRIRVEWIDTGRDEEVTFRLLSTVEAQHKN